MASLEDVNSDCVGETLLHSSSLLQRGSTDRNIEKQNKLEIKGRKIAPDQTYLSLQVSVKTRNDLVKSMIWLP